MGATVCALPKVRLGNGSAVSIATCAAGRTVCAAENWAGALRAAICGGCLAAWLAEKLGLVSLIHEPAHFVAAGVHAGQ